MPAKSYKLHKANGDKPSLCAFFLSEEGCKNGSKCKFLHSKPSSSSKKKKRVSAAPPPSSVISSESESESSVSSEEEVVVIRRKKDKKEKKSTEKKDKKKKKKTLAEPVSPASKRQKLERKSSWQELAAIAAPAPPQCLVDPPAAPSTPATESTKTKKKKTKSAKKEKKRIVKYESSSSEEDSDSSSSSEEEVIVKRKKQRKTKVKYESESEDEDEDDAPQQQQQQQPMSFRNLHLPIASFSIDEHGKGSNEKDSSDSEELCSDEESESSEETKTPPLPLPTSTPEGRKWSSAVLATRSHPTYANSFDYERTKDYELKMGLCTQDDWIKARPYGKWCKNNPHAIAIDCEMCQSKCPKTGVVNNKALCRISIVNAVDHSEVLLDTLVKPDWPVTDYRTFVNGIEKEHLENVKFTFKHAQEFMMALCSEETVVIGHAVNNDLMTLKMEHHCIVDSAYLFKCKEPCEHLTPSLSDLATGILKKDMPDTHDSVNDARTALLVLEEYVKNNGKVEPVLHTPRKRTGRREERAQEVFVHRIPRKCKEEHLSSMFVSHTYIQPKDVPIIDYTDKGNGRGRVAVQFHSKEHALLAYETLETNEFLGRFGEKQKKVFLKDGDYICLKKPGNRAPKHKKDNQNNNQNNTGAAAAGADEKKTKEGSKKDKSGERREREASKSPKKKSKR